jgi:hypothetical protein
VIRWLVAAFVVVGLAVGFAVIDRKSSTDPSAATTCQDLVARSAKVAQKVIDDLGAKTREDLEAENPDNPFGVLEQPFAAFQTRADQLHCDQGELRRLACDAYSDLHAHGPVAQEFLAPFVQNCR